MAGSGSFPALPLVRAVSASLRLVNESVGSLTTSQLSAIRFKLNETLGVIDGKLEDHHSVSGVLLPKVLGGQTSHSHSTEHQKDVIDNSDWEDGDSDEASERKYA